AARVAGAEGAVRDNAQSGGGSVGPGRTARLYQRVCRGGHGLGLSAASNRPCWSVRSPGGPVGRSHRPIRSVSWERNQSPLKSGGPFASAVVFESLLRPCCSST